MYLQLADNSEEKNTNLVYLAECLNEDEIFLADQCGLEPLKPIHTNEANSRAKNPDKWAKYDQKHADWVKCREDKGKSTASTAAIVLFAPGRALFNAMVDLNVDGLATKLARQNWQEVKSNWSKVGGDTNKLGKFINKGKDKKPKNIGFMKKFKGGALGDAYGTGYYLSEPTAGEKAGIVAAATAAGTTVGSIYPAIGNVTGAAAGASLGGLIVAILPLFKKAADDTAGDIPDVTPPQSQNIPDEPNITTGTDTTQTGISGLPSWAIPVGAGIVGLGLIYMLTKKK